MNLEQIVESCIETHDINVWDMPIDSEAVVIEWDGHNDTIGSFVKRTPDGILYKTPSEPYTIDVLWGNEALNSWEKLNLKTIVNLI